MTDTRRNVLRLGGTTLATLSLAGCSGGGTDTDTEPDDGGTESETTTATATAAGTETATTTETETAAQTDEAVVKPGDTRPETPIADYTDWFPAPSAIEFVDGGYAFQSMAPAALVDLSDSLGDGAVDGFEREIPNPGLETLEDATTLHQFARSCIAYESEFDRSTAEGEFEDLGFSAADAHRGFTVFTTASDTRAGAVGDGSIVTVGRFSSSEDVDKRPAVESIIDAKTGNADRYADAVDDCAELTSALGNAHLLQGRTHEAGATFDGAVGEGMATHVGSSDTRVRASVVFGDGAVDEPAVADWANDASAFYGHDPAVRTDGRVVDAAALAPSGEITSLPGAFPGPSISNDSPSTVPQATFEFEYEETGDGRGLVTIMHSAGDTVQAEELSVRGSGFADVSGADQTSAGQWQGTSGDDGSIRAGDRVSVGVESDYEIRVVFESESGGVSATLAARDGPDA